MKCRPFVLFVFLVLILVAYRPVGADAAVKKAVDLPSFTELYPPPQPKYGFYEWVTSIEAGYEGADLALITAEHYIRDHSKEDFSRSLNLIWTQGARQASITLAVADYLQTWQDVKEWLGAAWNANAEPPEVRIALEAAGWLRPRKQGQYERQGGEWQPIHKRWAEIDLDGDGRDEWLLSICLLHWQDGRCMARGWGQTGQFWIVSQGQVVYVDGPDYLSEQSILDAPNITSQVADMTGDGRPEIVTEQTDCGVNNYYNFYRIVSAHQGSIGPLTDKFGTSYSTIRLHDWTGDGLPDALVHGGSLGSSGAGPRREETIIFTWSNSRIEQIDVQLDPAIYRVHVLYEANDAFDSWKDEVAVSLYLRVINDESLQDVSTFWRLSEPYDYDDSRRFAAFRLILLYLRQGNEVEAMSWRDWLLATYPDSHIAQAAQRLLNQWATQHDLAMACSKVTAFLAPTNSTGVLSQVGYGNPSLGNGDVCPIE